MIDIDAVMNEIYEKPVTVWADCIVEIVEALLSRLDTEYLEPVRNCVVAGIIVGLSDGRFVRCEGGYRVKRKGDET